MKAIVLAGGFGTRLRPLTCTRPKLLLPVCNKPLLDWTLERLARSGIEEIILAVNYMAEAFVKRYRDSAYGMKLCYAKEEKPLRTGGPIKNAEELIGREEIFLALNGDILTDLDYPKILKEHKEKDATATIALHQVEDPSRYGLVEVTEQKRVVRFVEKPACEKAAGGLINAGVYVLDPKIFDYIPSDRPVSIEREVFPRLADEEELYGYPFEELWTDIGKPEDYLKANKLLLDTEFRKSRLGSNVHPCRWGEIKHPIMLGEKVVIGENSRVGPHVVVGKGVILGRKVQLQNSIIFPQTVISDATSVRDAIVGEDVTIGKRVKIGKGCLVGDHVVIRDDVTLTRDVTVCPSKEVSESVFTPKCLI